AKVTRPVQNCASCLDSLRDGKPSPVHSRQSLASPTRRSARKVYASWSRSRRHAGGRIRSAICTSAASDHLVLPFERSHVQRVLNNVLRSTSYFIIDSADVLAQNADAG